MLLRFTLSAAGALVLASTATAQVQTAQASPITTTVKDAGVYHLATGTWTRGVNASALAGPETIYDNTCTVGYYSGVNDGNILVDSGRVPSTSSTSPFAGLHDLYEVNGFTFAYCTFEDNTTNMDMTFIDCYAACDSGGSTTLPTPVAAFNIVNAPGGPGSNAQGCWILTFDLANTTGVFNLGGDCNGSYNNTASTDSFGWSWTQSIPTTGSNAGPIMAGDPNGIFLASGQICGGIGGGTTFVGAGVGAGTGIGLLDQNEISGVGATAAGCYWFGGYGGAGGNPYAGFYLQLQGDMGIANTGTGTPVCLGDGTGPACPCGNTGNTGAGCANSGGTGATLAGSGTASFTTDTFSLAISGVAGVKPGLLLRGNNVTGNPIGAGLICAGGGTMRSSVAVTDATGAANYTTWDGVLPLGSVANAVGTPTVYQFWYRDPMGSPCAGTDFNFTGAISVTYAP